MPYITKDRRQFATNLGGIFTPGELNYGLTIVLLDTFKKYPKYDTIHCLKRDFVIDPKNNKFLQAVRRELSDRFTVADVYAAAACAYDEFYRRVGVKYEEGKMAENGDLPEYSDLIAALKDGSLKATAETK